MPDYRQPQPYREFVASEEYPVRSPAQADSSADSAQKLGGLIEAVANLKATVKEQGDKLSDLSHEMHGYKVGFRWVKGVLIAMGGLIAWGVKVYFDSRPSGK